MILYCIFVILGAFCSLLLNLNEAVTLNNFSWKEFVKKNWLATATNVVLGCIIVACTYDDNALFEISKLSAFILGAVAQQFVKKLCNIFLVSKQTYVGFNKLTKTPNNEQESEEP